MGSAIYLHNGIITQNSQIGECGVQRLKKDLIDALIDVSLSMFRKNFFGIYHGSISAKIEEETFLINKGDAIFDEVQSDDFIKLYAKRDYRWKQASVDAEIHAGIYKYISSAKYITYTMPPYTTAYSMDISTIVPRDYFGYKTFKELHIYDPGNFDSWYDRASSEIYKYFKEHETNVMVIKGYGVYSYHRDLRELLKYLAILENSCKMLHYSQEHNLSLRSFPIG